MLLGDTTIAELLLAQAAEHPERAEVLERHLERAEPRARYLLAKYVGEELLEHEAVEKIVRPEALSRLRRLDPDFETYAATTIGRKLGADTVLFLEVRDFFVPDEECVLYGDDDFEETVLALLNDDARRERIARAGHRRVQEHRLGRRIGSVVGRILGRRRR